MKNRKVIPQIIFYLLGIGFIAYSYGVNATLKLMLIFGTAAVYFLMAFELYSALKSKKSIIGKQEKKKLYFYVTLTVVLTIISLLFIEGRLWVYIIGLALLLLIIVTTLNLLLGKKR